MFEIFKKKAKEIEQPKLNLENPDFVFGTKIIDDVNTFVDNINTQTDDIVYTESKNIERKDINNQLAQQLADYKKTQQNMAENIDTISKLSVSLYDILTKTSELHTNLSNQLNTVYSDVTESNNIFEEIITQTNTLNTKCSQQIKVLQYLNIQLDNVQQSLELLNKIKENSRQIDLLASNANIEAARAGEKGKGVIDVTIKLKQVTDENNDLLTKAYNSISDILTSIPISIANILNDFQIFETELQNINKTLQLQAQNIEKSDKIKTTITTNLSSIEQTTSGTTVIVDIITKLKQIKEII